MLIALTWFSIRLLNFIEKFYSANSFFFYCHLQFLLKVMAAILDQRSFQLKFLNRIFKGDFFPLNICKIGINRLKETVKKNQGIYIKI